MRALAVSNVGTQERVSYCLALNFPNILPTCLCLVNHALFPERLNVYTTLYDICQQRRHIHPRFVDVVVPKPNMERPYKNPYQILQKKKKKRGILSKHLITVSQCRRPECAKLVNTHPRSPPRLLLVNVDLVGKRVRPLRRYRRDMILVRVDESNDLHDGGHERRLHGFSDFGSLWKSFTGNGQPFIFVCPSSASITITHNTTPLYRVAKRGQEGKGKVDKPVSVLGSATVTFTVQHSQQTSSSPRMSQALRRFFSKN